MKLVCIWFFVCFSFLVMCVVNSVRFFVSRGVFSWFVCFGFRVCSCWGSYLFVLI